MNETLAHVESQTRTLQILGMELIACVFVLLVLLLFVYRSADKLETRIEALEKKNPQP